MLRSELGRRIVKTWMRQRWSQAELARRLGAPRERLVSDKELAELVFHLSAIARLLKPWRERRRQKDE